MLSVFCEGLATIEFCVLPVTQWMLCVLTPHDPKWNEWQLDLLCRPVTSLGCRTSCCVWSLSLSLQVLATGLSALYSSLPRKIDVQGDDWHALRQEDWMGVSSLRLFMNSLEFCNAVVQVAHPLVRSQLLDYLHNGFLVPVMGTALHTVGNVA